MKLPNGFIVVTGGQTQTATATTDLATAEMLDTSSFTAQSWTALPAMLSARRNHACSVVTVGAATGVMVAGGAGAFPAVQTSVEFLEVGTAGAVWRQMAPLKTPRWEAILRFLLSNYDL